MARLGVVDGFRSDLVFGWACDTEKPEEPSTVALEVNGKPVASVRCDIMRADLQDGGGASLRTGFRFDPLPFLAPGLNRCRVLFDGTRDMLRNGEHSLVVPRAVPQAGRAPCYEPALAWNTAQDLAGLLARHVQGEEPVRRVHVLGLFNSGTNYLAQLFIANQVAWLDHDDYYNQPKHFPMPIVARMKPLLSDKARGKILYAISARNPFQWVAAMKASRYGCHFDAVDAPFGMPFLDDTEGNTKNRRAAGLSERDWRTFLTAPNIVEYWNRYHAEWIERSEAELGRTAIVRYEDAVANPCEFARIFRYAIDAGDLERMQVNVASAKPGHARTGDFWTAKRKVMLPRPRQGLTPDEVAFISAQLSRDVCKHLNYAPTLDPARPARS